MYEAHLVGVYSPEGLPEELEGFVRFQASREGRDLRKGERIAVLIIVGTASYVPVFLEGLKDLADLESRLKDQDVLIDHVSKVSLERVIAEATTA